MKRVCWIVLLMVGLVACGCGPVLNHAQDAHLNASFACMSFRFVFPATANEKIAFTPQQRFDQISQAVGRARNAASEDSKWDAETRALDALQLSRNPAEEKAAVANVRKVCDPLNVANGITP